MNISPISANTNNLYSKITELPKIKHAQQNNISISTPASYNSVNTKKSNYKKYLLWGGLGIVGLLGAIGGASKILRKTKQVTPYVSDYVKTITKSFNEHYNQNIPPSNLRSLISADELLVELKKLKKENYIASNANIKTGTFTADLHSHSIFSDGKANVESLLNEVANYANQLNKKNNNKFIFALTDHDTCNGVKEAIKLIAENPEKYKNVRFITGAELSLAVKSNKTNNNFETAEILAYGFNPFDKKISTFFENIQNKRKGLSREYIEELKKRFGYADFSLDEFLEIYLENSNNLMMNNQWKVHHYGQTKNAMAGLANELNKDKKYFYSEIMPYIPQQEKTLGHLRDRNLIPRSYGDDTNITKLCKEIYSPHYENGKINFAGENNFDELVSVFEPNKDTFFALAHPYYITEKNTDAIGTIQDLISRSKGLLKATESHHQAYSSQIPINDIEQLNANIVKNNLLELGGRDKHSAIWLKY